MADKPVDPLPVAPPVLANSASIWPSRNVCGPVTSDVTSTTVMPASAQDLVMAEIVAASRGLGA